MHEDMQISIHAPSRERHNLPLCFCLRLQFQSTLPRGSDLRFLSRGTAWLHFNPRSLARATFEVILLYI